MSIHKGNLYVEQRKTNELLQKILDILEKIKEIIENGTI